MRNTFIELLRSTNRSGVEALLQYLDSTDFYDVIASTTYHCNYNGGLLEHSLNVCNYALKLKDAWESNVSDDSVIICSLLHDVGKSNKYYVDNTLKSGNISKAKPYKINSELRLKNHALRSLLTVSKYIELSEDEQECILAHDGFYEHANKEYWYNPTELMMLIHFADLYVARNVEVCK